ncbi:MAG: nucleotidyl transferase AbiEii/AbiGii toxin family protein [Bacteroidales bacterium]|jgi:predicted nucleotidyltransferase component of viral defense system|nr:nucleotidyl transferase AbiEii/AbiGii toxin family protein [Bacteroidales bacterium]
MNTAYKKQVALLLNILPYITEEENFALHGGTAINLFYLNMPRLSIDIDLTFIPFTNNRNNDLEFIRNSLNNVKKKLSIRIPKIHFEDQRRANEDLKLICSTSDATIKIEVNQINRGLIADSSIRVLCEGAQEEFNCFCEARTVSFGQLWGGKIAAALDRQHPRDLFDIRNLLENNGYTDDVKSGFIFFLLCGKRPIHEMLNPQKINQQAILESQFNGMTYQPFLYKDYENTQKKLISIVKQSLTSEDKTFIKAFAKGEPIWEKVNYSNFPAIKWKLLNIQKLKSDNSEKFYKQIELLDEILSTDKINA